MANISDTGYQSASTMDDFSPIPAGEYPAVITESEIKATKDGQGQYLKLKIEIIEGEFQGRLIFMNLNLWNQNPKAAEIARRELATIAAATGKVGASDSAEFHNIPMIVKVAVEPGSGEYGPQNRIKMYSAYQSAASAPSSSAPNGTAQPAQPINVQTQQPPAGDINPATGKLWKPWEKR